MKTLIAVITLLVDLSCDGAPTFTGKALFGQPPCEAPAITSQPASLTCLTNATTNFVVVATGTALTYQWKTNGVNVINNSNFFGATAATLWVSNSPITYSNLSYTVAIVGQCGSVNSSAAIQTVTNGVGGGGGGNGLLTGLVAVCQCEDANSSDLTEASGSGLTLTHHGTTTRRTEHIQGSFSDSGGGGGYWDSTASGLKMASAFTFGGWVQFPSSFDGQYQVSEYNTGTGFGWLIYTAAAGNKLRMWSMVSADSGTPVIAESTVSASADGKWHYILAGFNGTQNLMSFDFETIVTISCPNGIPASPANFTFSDLTGGSGAAATSYRDESYLWSRALSQSDLTAIKGTWDPVAQTGTPLFFINFN